MVVTCPKPVLWLIAGLAVVAAACGDGQVAPITTAGNGGPTTQTTAPIEEREPVTDETGPDTTPPDRTMPPNRTPERVPDTSPPILGEVPDDLLDAIRADAAARTGTAAADLVVTRAQAVAWNDGSLGCAQPGESYIQVIVLGFWVEIDAAGHSLDYRADERGFFKLCEGPVVVPPPTTAPSS